MSWTATSNAAWLKLSAVSGTILHEGENSVILLINPKTLKTGLYKGSFQVSTSGNEKIYSVNVTITGNN
jgi:hypothetical protein